MESCPQYISGTNLSTNNKIFDKAIAFIGSF